VWNAYVDYVDEIVVDGFFNTILCSLKFILENTDAKTTTEPLYEAVLELQVCSRFVCVCVCVCVCLYPLFSDGTSTTRSRFSETQNVMASYFAPGMVQRIVMSISIYLLVCPLKYLENYVAVLNQLFSCICCCRGSVLM